VNPVRASGPVPCEVKASPFGCFSGVSRSRDELIDQLRRGMSGKQVAAIKSLHRLE
jgi:hypothetical protein